MSSCLQFVFQVQMPMDYQTEKHRGFAFVEFELQEDAQAAIDNMVRVLSQRHCSIILKLIRSKTN